MLLVMRNIFASLVKSRLDDRRLASSSKFLTKLETLKISKLFISFIS